MAVTAALSAVIDAATLLDPDTFDRYRYWAVGSIGDRDPDILRPVVPFIAAGAVVAVLTGPDNRWVLAYTAVPAPTLLLAADVVGRVVVLPGELSVGIVTALVGGPVFIALVRRRRVPQL